MNKTLRLGVFAAILAGSCLSASAQNERFAYAITDATKEGFNWSVLRKIDLNTGEYSPVLFNGVDANAPVYDAVSKKQLTLATDARYGNALNIPFSTGVAAAAYDPTHDRIYFTPMFIDQLRYIDLKTNRVYYVSNKAFTGLGNMHNEEGKCITRMVITPDGTGYAISNDGNTFIQFTTGRETKVSVLGSLVDAPANGTVSVHNRCSSFGGDMIADNEGNLYVISARNMVFKVTPENRVATLLGTIQGLPGAFTTNGAVVNADGNLVVCSAVDGSGSYVVNPKDWSAQLLKGGAFHSSDLANSNYLATRKNPNAIDLISTTAASYNDRIQVYPNPVTNNVFTMQFTKVPSGDYTLQVTDANGKTTQTRRISITMDSQVQQVNLSRLAGKGFYLVRLIDNSGKGVYEQKLLLQ
ncbi:MAG: T9SS type A sorting domain-containing protein [Sphingobacteriales bacterium]|nr:MAG: T9SS type A sorting domain-containing protein [Sphingobacteriales bacterium]